MALEEKVAEDDEEVDGEAEEDEEVEGEAEEDDDEMEEDFGECDAS